uniref:Uncharacterized protein n=1 Tax=Oryza glumipatula TaxID=40148 RepID=A0A0E0ASK3_9ORYZ
MPWRREGVGSRTFAELFVPQQRGEFLLDGGCNLPLRTIVGELVDSICAAAGSLWTRFAPPPESSSTQFAPLSVTPWQ